MHFTHMDQKSYFYMCQKQMVNLLCYDADYPDMIPRTAFASTFFKPLEQLSSEDVMHVLGLALCVLLHRCPELAPADRRRLFDSFC